jgi:hypothetical protein
MRRKLWISIGVVAVAVLIVLVLGIERGSAPSFVLFVGRFHPTVVHFPIAFLILAIAIEALASVSVHVGKVRPAVPFILLLGSLSALASVVLGYLLSLGGGYDEDLLSVHMWLGLGVMVLAFVLAFLSSRTTYSVPLFRGSLYALGALVIVAGHLGGSLARGSGYLTYYLPAPLKQLAGFDVNPGGGLIANIDSAYVYADLVQPVFDQRCVKCHGGGKSKGDLRLDSREGVEAGGRDGDVVVAGNPSQSEVIRRITLAPYEEDSMPPDGEMPLDVGETELIRWWIENGASFDVKVAQIEEMPSAVLTYLNRVAAPRTPMISGIFALDVPEADSAVIMRLLDEGMAITQITPDAPFLLVSASSLGGRFTDTELESLRPIAPQIAHLDLGRTAITTSGTSVIAAMPHLTHLHLENTRLGDDGLAHLAGHEYLEYLNVFGTDISDVGLANLEDVTSLRSVYVWRTGVTEEGAGALRSAVPGIAVNLGTHLVLVEEDSTSTAAP